MRFKIGFGLNLQVAFLVLLLLFSSLNVINSSASSIRNGISCSKIGKLLKTQNKIYRCGKNPFLKPTQLTWTLRGCFTAYSLWQSSKKQYEDFIDIAKLAGAEGEKTMNDLLASIAALEDTMKNEVCKKGA